jgi:spore coat polysaccharide biosynthesis protein SpsF
VRVTADCPLIEPEILDAMIEDFSKANVDYISNNKPPTFPHGLDAEVFTFASLERAWKEAKLESEREHVTPYIWKNSEKFKIRNFSQKKDQSDYRWTVDRKEDLEVIRTIYSLLGERGLNHEFSWKDVLEIFENHPELRDINKGIDRLEGYKKSLKEDAR